MFRFIFTQFLYCQIKTIHFAFVYRTKCSTANFQIFVKCVCYYLQNMIRYFYDVCVTILRSVTIIEKEFLIITQFRYNYQNSKKLAVYFLITTELPLPLPTETVSFIWTEKSRFDDNLLGTKSGSVIKIGNKFVKWDTIQAKNVDKFYF